MQRILFSFLILAAMCGGSRGVSLANGVDLGNGLTAQVFFSPRGGSTQAVVDALDASQESVYVQAYSFTSKPIMAALMAAHARGVVVQVIADRSCETSRGSITQALQAAGVSVLYDEEHAIAHNKVMVIDGALVVTGSFNFTGNAESSNAENLLMVPSPALAAAYLQNWTNHQQHSVGR